MHDISTIMIKDQADSEPDIKDAVDRGEQPSLMEPLLIAEGSRHRGALTDLAIDLASRAAGFRRSLPEGIRVALADLVRAMNCYYSNLIEGHDTLLSTSSVPSRTITTATRTSVTSNSKPRRISQFSNGWMPGVLRAASVR